MRNNKIPNTMVLNLFSEDLVYNRQQKQFEVDQNIRIIGKFQNYFIHVCNKIINGKLITTAYVKFENSQKIQFKMKNLVQQLILKLNGYTKVGFFIIKKNQIMYRMCQNIANQWSQNKNFILENVISSNDSIIRSIIQKYYVFFYPYLFEMNLPQHYLILGMKSQAQFIQQLEEQIRSHLKDISKISKEKLDSLILGQPNIYEIYIHGDRSVVHNQEFLARFNFFNSQSDIYQTKLLFKNTDSYMDVLQKTNSPFLETIYKYNCQHFREKNSLMLSLHQFILNNKPLGLFRKLQIVRDVCEGIKSFKYHQREDQIISQQLQQSVESTNKEYLQIQIINPHTIMITPQLSSFILIWPYQNNQGQQQYDKGKNQNDKGKNQNDKDQYQNFQYKDNNEYVKFNTLEKHTIYSIGKLLSLFFSSKHFQIEGPSFFIESIKNLIYLCQSNSNITIEFVVNILNLLQKYLDQFD